MLSIHRRSVNAYQILVQQCPHHHSLGPLHPAHTTHPVLTVHKYSKSVTAAFFPHLPHLKLFSRHWVFKDSVQLAGVVL